MDYKIYTTDYDRVVRPAEIRDPDALAALSAHWDTFVAEHPDFFQYFHMPDFGYMDTPQEAITLLLDCSGSMRGPRQYQQTAAVLAFGDCMSKIGHPLRILGHTTGCMKGGKSRAQWVADGKPAQPGRLNDMLFIIFHQPEDDWADTRQGLFLLLDDSVLKENIDGEALIWAAQEAEGGRIIYFTDGLCVDGSTLATAHTRYLDEHRDAVVRDLREQGTELICISSSWDSTALKTPEEQKAFDDLFAFTFHVEKTEGAGALVKVLAQAVSVKFPVPEIPVAPDSIWEIWMDKFRKHFSFS